MIGQLIAIARTQPSTVDDVTPWPRPQTQVSPGLCDFRGADTMLMMNVLSATPGTQCSPITPVCPSSIVYRVLPPFAPSSTPNVLLTSTAPVPPSWLRRGDVGHSQWMFAKGGEEDWVRERSEPVITIRPSGRDGVGTPGVSPIFHHAGRRKAEPGATFIAHRNGRSCTLTAKLFLLVRSRHRYS